MHGIWQQNSLTPGLLFLFVIDILLIISFFWLKWNSKWENLRYFYQIKKDKYVLNEIIVTDSKKKSIFMNGTSKKT